MQKQGVYFVVVTWNNQDIILECLESIKRQIYKDIHIILVDNASSDVTVEVVRSAKINNITILENKKNEGFAIANNQGIRLALSDNNCGYVALLNSDARIDKAWTETLVSFAQKNQKVAALQTITLDYFDHNTVDSWGIKVGLSGNALQLGYRKPLKRPHKDTRVFGVNAAACIYTAEFLLSQPFGDDYFDSDMWMYLEDVDLAARATILGYSSWVVGDGVYAYHMGSASSSKNPGFSVFHIYRNNYLMLLKNLPAALLARATIGTLISDIVTIIKLARHRNTTSIKAIIKGRLASLKLIPLFIKKRKKVMRARKISSESLKELMRAS